jgi:acyl dehydratase
LQQTGINIYIIQLILNFSHTKIFEPVKIKQAYETIIEYKCTAKNIFKEIMMEISSSFTGTLLRPLKKTVTLRDTMNYAAGVFEANPSYLDDERPGGIMAPPMFAVRLTWPLISNIQDYIEDASFPRELMMTIVHYTEHIRFSRPIRPEDELEIKGEIAAILPRRAGTLIVIKLVAFDCNKSHIFTEHLGGMLRGVKCTDKGRGAENLPLSPVFVETSPVWEKSVSINPLAAHIYDGCTDIHFPIHTSPRFAHAVGLPGIILQGTATLAYAMREITDVEASGDPSKIDTIACKFTGMVIPGTKISIRLLHRNGKGGLFFDVLNDQGKQAIGNGYINISEK